MNKRKRITELQLRPDDPDSALTGGPQSYQGRDGEWGVNVYLVDTGGQGYTVWFSQGQLAEWLDGTKRMAQRFGPATPTEWGHLKAKED